MEGIIFVILISCIFLFISYLYSAKDLLSPNVLFFAGFILAFLAALMNVQKRGIDLSYKTIFILFLGQFSFFIGSLIPFRPRSKIINNGVSEIYISSTKTLFIVLISFASFYFYYKDIVRIASYAHPYWQSVGLMVAYKQALTYGGVSISGISNYLSKFVYCFGYIYLFSFFSQLCNFNHKKNIKKLFITLIPVILYFVMAILKGNRIDIITLIIAGAFFYYYRRKAYRGRKRVNNKKIVKKVVVVFGVGIFLFYSLKSIFGRSSSLSFIDYVTQYIGGSIELLDLYIQSGVKQTSILFGETLTGLIAGLNKIGLCSVTISKQLEFRTTPTGIYLGNVYTAFRRYYNDLSYIGVFIFPLFLSVFYNLFYGLIGKRGANSLFNCFLIIVYGSLLYAIPLQAIEDCFYINKISIGYFVELVILFLCCIFILPPFNVRKKELLQ